MDENCKEYAILAAQVTTILEHVSELTRRQLKLFKNKTKTEFMRLDKDMENAMGKKERCIGALRQHEADHHCQQ
ncbi:MAG TPA: hypothetical protein VN727_12735 [Candidatus Binatia bacterium]|nr:hypothetical protein [Candidatus Binatia bacterium]